LRQKRRLANIFHKKGAWPTFSIFLDNLDRVVEIPKMVNGGLTPDMLGNLGLQIQERNLPLLRIFHGKRGQTAVGFKPVPFLRRRGGQDRPTGLPQM
jgi:hypothetical protein